MKNFSKFMFLAAVLNTGLVSASSSCRSIQGYWVDFANAETEKLKSSIRALETMQNKSCKTLIDQLHGVTSKLSGLNLNSKEKKILETPKQVSQSIEMAQLSSDDKVAQNLVKQTLSSHIGVNENLTNDPKHSLFQRARSFITDNSKTISDLSGTLNSKDTIACLENSNAAGQAIKAFGSIATILSAFTGSGVGAVAPVVDAASVLVQALSSKNISKALNSIESSQLLSTLSCVVETTVANYCEIQDAFDFYENISKQNSKITQLNKKYARINSTGGNALDSYYILHRDLPNIVSWIIKTKMVNMPYSESDAKTQMEYANVINNFYNRIRRVNGIYQSKKREIYSEGCNDICKKRIMAVMLGSIASVLVGIQAEEEGVRTNFFVQQYDLNGLVFAILGKPVPPNVSGQFEEGKDSWIDPLTGILYTSKRAPDSSIDFLKNGGKSSSPHPYLNDPLTLINIIGDNLDKIFEKTIARATNFELENLVGDKTNLVTRLTSSPTTSVHGSFRNIRNYLVNFKTTIEDKLLAQGNANLVNRLNGIKSERSELGDADSLNYVKEQKAKLTKEVFDLSIALRDINELLSKVNPILNILNEYALGRVDAQEVLFVVYNKLLISVNGANYLPNRIETLAQVELRMALRDDKSFIRDNFKDWFLVSDQTLYSFMSPTVLDTQTSAAIRESQFNTALRIAETNLSALETTFKDWIFAYIISLRAIDASKDSGKMTSANYSPEIRAVKEYASAALDYENAVRNKAKAAQLDKLKKRKDALLKKSATQFALKNNPHTGMISFAVEKFSYWGNELFNNAKTIKLKNIEEHIKRGSFKFWADRLCIQSLAFINTQEERNKFDLYCGKAVLTNNDVAELERQKIISPSVILRKKLKVSYAELSRSINPKDRICAFRDYFRSNESMQKLITTLDQDDVVLNDEY